MPASIVGGVTAKEYEAKLAKPGTKAATEAATLEAAEEIHRRAESEETTPGRRWP